MAHALNGSAGLSIGEVALRAGVRTSAIRYYESAGLLTLPRRVSGRRIYEEGVLDVLRLIELAKCAGFTMAEIRRLLTGFDRATPASARWQTMARAKLDEVTAVIDRAQRMRAILDLLLTCECVSLTECVRPAERASIRRNRGLVARGAP